MPSNKSHISYSFWTALLVIVMLLSATMVPRVKMGEYESKRINILSDIITLDRDVLNSADEELVLDTTFISDLSDTLGVHDDSATYVAVQELGGTAPKIGSVRKKNVGVSVNDLHITPIEEYDTVISPSSISIFYSKLSDSTKRDIRIAFLGDSFIEGDLFTADVRELLQSKFSGRGVGFVPITSIVSQFRGSVKHTFDGWIRHSLLTPKSTPEALKDKFYVSGELFEATEGAYVRYEGVKYRKHLSEFSLARFVFMNRGNSTINTIINDTIIRTFTPQSSEEIQQINITGDINSLEVKIENPEDFIGYGVVLEDGFGAVVDNYSLRGNSGLSLCGSSHVVNQQINNSLRYDLIVLQYGLNVLTADVSDYRGYSRLMRRVVSHIRRSFPNSSILLMGVSDRSVQIGGEFITMPTLKNMLEAQQAVAESCGISFWSTYQAMGGENSMVDFVEKKWGAKDYTHFSQAGGKFLAKKFVASLFRGAENFALSGSDNPSVSSYIDSTLTNSYDYSIESTPQSIRRVVHQPISYDISPLPALYDLTLDDIDITYD